MSERAAEPATILTSIARGLQQQQDLLVIEMFQGVDVIDDLRSEEAVARVTRRRRHAHALAHATQRRLQAATRAFEGAALLRSTILVELRLVGVHVIQSRVLKPVSCRRLVVHGPCGGRSLLSLRKGGSRNESVREGATLLFDGWIGTSLDLRPSGRH